MKYLNYTEAEVRNINNALDSIYEYLLNEVSPRLGEICKEGEIEVHPYSECCFSLFIRGGVTHIAFFSGCDMFFFEKNPDSKTYKNWEQAVDLIFNWGKIKNAIDDALYEREEFSKKLEGFEL